MGKITQWMERAGDRLLDPGAARWWRFAGWCLLAFLLLDLVLGCYWSREPDTLDVIVQTEAVVQTESTTTPGELTTRTLMQIAAILLDKPGGYVSNDIMPHRLWLDNMPNWEYGVLVQVRDTARVFRRDLGRPLSRTEPGRTELSQTEEDSDLVVTENQFNFDHRSWAMPATETEYRRGIRALQQYLDRLTDPDKHSAHFNLRAESLDYWLAEVQGRLADLSQRLSQSVGRPAPYISAPGTVQDETTPSEAFVRTPRFDIDDVFYQARGGSWALLHLMRAAEQEFKPVLQTPEARGSMRQLIRELEATQQSLRSPMVLNGSGFGIFANHSLVMANYISRANAALMDLRGLLQQ